MEDEIQEKLEEIYTFPIEVEWVQFRQYRIIGKIKDNSFKIYYTYDVNFSNETNINSMKQKIDAEILKLFKTPVGRSCRPIRKYLYVGGIVTDFGHNTSCCVIRLLSCPWFCRGERCNRPLWRWAG